MRSRESFHLMAFKAHDGFRLLENYPGLFLTVFRAVARHASLLECGMNVLRRGVIAMAFQAVRLRIDWNRVCARVAQARKQQAGNDHTKQKARDKHKSHRSWLAFGAGCFTFSASFRRTR